MTIVENDSAATDSAEAAAKDTEVANRAAEPRDALFTRIRLAPGTFARRVEGWPRRRKTLVLTPLALVTIGLIAAVTVLGVRIHDNDDVQAAKGAALAAAVTNVPKILSYRADSADNDLESAANLLTGDFKNRFQTLVKDTIIPAAKQHQTVTNATVAAKSVVDGTSDAVTVLLFIDQSTTSKDAPAPRLDASRVRIHMDRIGDRWLISGLEPV
ncbi:hypothetical protein ACFYXQ_33585 [Nocardia jiangxiensis]|uniref:Mce-associated membrane protein n=1 Tax=Nocardia jiangxiensis TaxID=282685 RepID=A0ABW6S8T9_9NOCA